MLMSSGFWIVKVNARSLEKEKIIAGANEGRMAKKLKKEAYYGRTN